MTKVKPALAEAGARYLARGGKHKIYEGDWTPRLIVLLEFPTVVAPGPLRQASPAYAGRGTLGLGGTIAAQRRVAPIPGACDPELQHSASR
jgi:hypothetical protein